MTTFLYIALWAFGVFCVLQIFAEGKQDRRIQELEKRVKELEDER